MDDLAQAVKALTEELKTFREALTVEFTDDTKMTALEYLADQIRNLSCVVETHAIASTGEEPRQDTQDERND